MSKTDEHKIDNQWIPCAKRMPTEGVAWYLVTLQKHEKRWVEYLYYTWDGSSYKYAFQRQTGEPIDAKIIAWMLKPKPYQQPEEIPFDLKFFPFSVLFPNKIGKYLLYNEKTGECETLRDFLFFDEKTGEGIPLRDHNYRKYTHWALVSEEK